MELDQPTQKTRRNIEQLVALRERIDDLSSRLTPNGGLDPKIDLMDLGEAYCVVVEVPGVQQEDLEVALQGLTLTIAGIRDPYRDGATLLMQERASGHFQRSLELPGEVVRDGSSAHLREGLLVLHLPKA